MRKNKNRNRIYTVFDLGRVKPTSGEPVVKSETAKEFYARLEREERERREAPLKAAQQQLAATLRQIHQGSADFWSLPLPNIQAQGPDAPFAFVDLGLELLPESADAGVAAKSSRAEFNKFVASLPARGYTLSPEGILRFGSLCQASVLNGVWLTPTAIATLWEWAVKWEIFAESEIGIDDAVVHPPEPERQKSFEEILAASDGSRESDAALRRAVQNEVVGSEFGDIWQQWTDSVRENFGVTLQKHQHEAAWQFFTGMNLSPLKPENFDAARRHLVSRNLLPETCLTCREVLDRDYSARRLTDRDYLRQCSTFERSGVIDRPRVEAGI